MLFALHVGNNYAGTENELPDCELDARNMQKAFSTYCHAQKMLCDATRADILSAGRVMKAQLKPGDLWVITNSGHGTQDKVNGRTVEAIVCKNFELIYDYEMDHLIDYARAAGSLVWAISDSCFSGGMERRPHHPPAAARGRHMPIEHCKSHPANPPLDSKPLTDVVYFSGCKKNEVSYSTGHGGALTNAFLQAFAEQGVDTTFGQLFERIGGQHGLLPTHDWTQHPQCVAESRDLRKTVRKFVGAK
jgi:hypothetical protein